MQIFFLSKNPEAAARYHNNKHVVKMIIESAQILSAAHHYWDPGNINIPYKLSHRWHPAVHWARKTQGNYLWLVRLAKALCKEYRFRYGYLHDRQHKSCDAIKWLAHHIPVGMPKKGMTVPPQMIHIDCRNSGRTFADTVSAYRRDYMQYKRHFSQWGRRGSPYWFK